MPSSRELLNSFFDCLRHLDHSIDRCLDLFADDGAFEFPYFSVLGMPTRFQGKAELRQVLGMINARLSNFTVSGVDIHEVKTGDALFVRYHTDAFIDGSERVYAQDYVS
jgi:hypothetical protein